MLYRLRVWLARRILPRGWFVVRNQSSFRDGFAGELLTALIANRPEPKGGSVGERE